MIEDLKGIGGKARDQIVKDYIGWPAISALAAGAADFVVRRDKDKALKRARDTFKKAAVGERDRERRAQPLVARDHLLRPLPRPDLHVLPGGDRGREPRRLVRPPARRARRTSRAGRSSTSMSGNLGYQVEHHLFPDMPSSRYAQIAPRVKDICERYELPYNTGPFFQQWGMVNRTILRLAFPGGKPRPKPGPYMGGEGSSAAGANGASRNGDSKTGSIA